MVTTSGTVGDMTELPDVAPVADTDLKQADLLPVLEGLAPGWYTSRDLVRRMNVWLASKGRDPVSAKTMGEAMARRLKLDRRNGPGHVRQFHVTPAAVAGRDWFVEPSAGTDPAAERST